MIRWNAVIVLAAAASLAGCEGFKEAMTAHVDVAARAGSQELSSQRLADVLAPARVPVRREVFEDFTRLWVDYQLLGHAAAHGDTLADPKLINDAAWGMLAQQRLQRFFQHVSRTTPVDSASEARYNEGRVLAVRHILLSTPRENATPQQVDSVRRAAETLRATLTNANFEAAVRRSSQDPGSVQRGGRYVFSTGDMVPEFEQASKSLKPGEISAPVQTQFGFHIIQRLPYAAVREEFATTWNQKARTIADSTYVAQLEAAGNIQVKKNAAAKVRAIAKDPDAHRKDNEVLATSTAGNFTGAQMVRWFRTLPPQARPQIAQAPDSVLPDLVKAMVRNELMLKRADSLKIAIDSSEMSQLYAGVRSLTVQLWDALGVSPASLADSGRAIADRERIAGERVNRYLEELVAGRKQFVNVPDELSGILRAKFEYKVVPQGIDRAVERAQKQRAATDSAGRAGQPPSAVPLPDAARPQGQTPSQGQSPPQGAPQGQPVQPRP